MVRKARSLRTPGIAICSGALMPIIRRSPRPIVRLVSSDASSLAAPQVGRAPAAPRARTAPATSFENSNFSERGALRRASAVASSVAKRGAGSVEVVVVVVGASSEEAQTATEEEEEEVRRRGESALFVVVREALPTTPIIGCLLAVQVPAAIARAEVVRRRDCIVSLDRTDRRRDLAAGLSRKRGLEAKESCSISLRSTLCSSVVVVVVET